MKTSDTFVGRASELRAEFDASFAQALETGREDRETLLAIRAGDGHFALRVSELLRIEAGRSVIALPHAPPELLGLAGIHGRLVPVYSLALLLGVHAGTGGTGQWLALCSTGSHHVALEFSDLEGHLEVQRADLFRGAAAPGAAYACEFVRFGGTARAVIDLPAVLRAMQDKTPVASR